ncbi:MAG: pyruvate ferredoxin oxidoreductase [Candidatus Hecatellales archaeon]|nr:MAG: pyruvate ferredoxin oxidoreductase [Candidatus Hecatellales archaeon]
MVCAYPITPQTPIVEYIAEFIARGEMKSKYLTIEGEHSAMMATVAAASTGVRTFTATSSQGLSYMQEGLFYAAGSRLPIVMAVVNRSMGPPWTILTGHDDSIAQRDTGWMQVYCGSGQEILDTIIQAYRIAEDERVLIPIMVCFEGFVTSHCYEEVVIPDEEEVEEYLPPYRPAYKLDVEDPLILTTFAPPAHWMGYKKKHDEAMEAAKKVIMEAEEEFAERFGRRHGGLLQAYHCEDAEAVILTMGNLASTTRLVVEKLRREGFHLGLVKLRSFRPFPASELRELLGKVKAVGVLERNYSVGGFGGAVYHELRSALYGLNGPRILGFIAGMGGKDVTPSEIEAVAKKTLRAASGERIEGEVEWLLGGMA